MRNPTGPTTKREIVLAALGATAFALAFCHPMRGHLGEAGYHHDWDLLWQLDWAACGAVMRHHQLPLWNPYKCGGMPLLANPHSRILTPFFLLHLLFGPVAGLHLEIPVHLAIGWAGGYMLARIQGLGPLAAVAGASLFLGSSWIALRLAVGHLVYLPSLYLPWIAALVWLGAVRRSPLFAALAGLLVAITLGEGGVYPVPHALLLGVLLSSTLAIARRSPWPLLAVLVFMLFSVGFAAAKLLPAYDLMRLHPRPIEGAERGSLDVLFAALFSRNQDLFRHFAGPFWGFHEYGAYVGPLGAVLALAGIAASPRRAAPWLVTAGTFLLLAMGNSLGAYSPWPLLHHLPVFSSERVPARFLIPFTLATGMLVAHGVQFLRTSVGRIGRLAAPLLVGALVLDLWLVSPANLGHMFGGEQVVRPAAPEFTQTVTTAAHWEMLSVARANMGAIDCHEYTIFTTKVRGADQAGYRGEQYLLGSGDVRLLEWTPNALEYAVETSAPTVLVVNQNYDPGWEIREGDAEVFSQGGLLAARLLAGKQRVRLVYRSRLFRVGLAITIVSLVAALALARFERRRGVSGPTTA